MGLLKKEYEPSKIARMYWWRTWLVKYIIAFIILMCIMPIIAEIIKEAKEELVEYSINSNINSSGQININVLNNIKELGYKIKMKNMYINIIFYSLLCVALGIATFSGVKAGILMLRKKVIIRERNLSEIARLYSYRTYIFYVISLVLYVMILREISIIASIIDIIFCILQNKYAKKNLAGLVELEDYIYREMIFLSNFIPIGNNNIIIICTVFKIS